MNPLTNIHPDDLDLYERQEYDNFTMTMSHEEALQIIINNAECDYSQLSPALAEIAIEQDENETFLIL
ncbi:MAG: hypothetical protein KBC56_04855 [Flavobacterium sp.]|nr:hypothetical protein [Flavobacterium sp.]